MGRQLFWLVISVRQKYILMQIKHAYSMKDIHNVVVHAHKMQLHSF